MENEKAFYDAALEIAQRKLVRDQVASKLNSPRMGTGGSFTDTFFWDTVFTAQWAKYHTKEFPVADSLDNFYIAQEEDGFISRQIHPNGKSKWSKEHPVSFAPPLLSWIELELHQKNILPGRLNTRYPKLKRLHEFNRRSNC